VVQAGDVSGVIDEGLRQGVSMVGASSHADLPDSEMEVRQRFFRHRCQVAGAAAGAAERASIAQVTAVSRHGRGIAGPWEVR
jgi:hypothetical protein